MNLVYKNGFKEHKWGDVRKSDGKIFWGYHKNRPDLKNPNHIYEEWIGLESFERRAKKLKEYTKKYRKLPKNIERRKKTDKIYYSKQENRQRRRNWWSKYLKERKARDPQYAIGLRVRTRICMALKNAGVKKSLKTRELIGCSYAELHSHIEAQFRDGMAWDKPNSFHIDHIRPLCSFDLTDPEQLKKACHWKNLQPLYPHENIAKSGKFIKEYQNDTRSI